MKPVVFTGGGTGGHIYPGLAIANELKDISKDCSIIWIGSNNGRDKTMVESNVSKSGDKSCDRFIAIPSGKLRRYFSFQNFTDFFKIGFGFLASIFILLRVKPAFVFSKGGFVSVPPCAAARLLRIPVYTHECDFSPGLATKINMRFAKKIFVSYEESKKFFSQKQLEKIVVTGNPVRDVFWNTNTQIGFDFLELSKPKKPILLVLGGSSGAHQINDLILQNLDWLLERFVVVHQTGMGEDYNNALEEKNQRVNTDSVYLPFDFIYSQMPHVVACADIVLSRSGANSLWESAVVGKPLVLVPLAGSGTRGDQIENAHHFQESGAAIVIDSLESDFSVFSENVKSALDMLLRSDVLKKMQKAIRGMITQNSSKVIADILTKEKGNYSDI